MTYRIAEAFLPYLTFSIYGTSDILRMTDGHPYGEIGYASRVVGYGGGVREGQDPPLQWVGFASRLGGTWWMGSGGSRPSPTMGFIFSSGGCGIK